MAAGLIMISHAYYDFFAQREACEEQMLKMARAMNWMPHWLTNCKMNPWAYGHEMMKFPKQSFHVQWKKLKKDDSGTLNEK